MVLNNRGYFFSLDALIALIIVFAVVLLIRPPTSSLHNDLRVQDDFIKSLGTVHMYELNHSYAQLLTLNGSVTNDNLSVLEQIGEFYARGDSQAKALAQAIINDMNFEDDIALYYGSTLIANSSVVNYSSAREIKTSREIISGIGGGVNASSGYSSRAFLYSENKIKYFYFGGYVGDGNLSVLLGDNVVNALIEADFSSDFDLYINDIFISSYSPTPGVPYAINLINASGNFSLSSNNISFRSDNDLAISGGYVKVTYNDSSFDTFDKFLPGITGFINLYDGFYIPGNLTSMEVFLHYESPYDVFLDLGGERVYVGNSSTSDISVTLSDVNLTPYLDYATLSQNTVPLRVGYVNLSNVTATDTDVFSVVDISGSMNENEVLCGGSNKLMDCARDANKEFVDILTAFTNLRVGLTGYKAAATDDNFHNLSNDSVSLYTQIDYWSPGGGSCLCCGINKAVQGFLADSNDTALKSMVVMGDGKPNGKCDLEQGTGSAEGDAVQAACDAYNDHGIKIYAIGFGSDLDETVLQDIASCGNGDYYFSNVTSLTQVYGQIADDILSASYIAQSIVGEGVTNRLFPDSKISFEYNASLPYGMVLTSESATFDNTIAQGNFTFPSDSTPYNIGVVSYSGALWTHIVEVYDNVTGLWTPVFNLSNYTDDFTTIGDPYIINIPPSMIQEGENVIRVSTATNATNVSGGSRYNKIIYSLIKDIAAYSEVLPAANGCIWHIAFEDLTNTTMYFPSSYSGSDHCYFASDDFFIAGNNVIVANENDAVSQAVLNLLSSLDLNNNDLIDIKFTESDLTLDSVEIEGLPFTWETEVQSRAWR